MQKKFFRVVALILGVLIVFNSQFVFSFAANGSEMTVNVDSVTAQPGDSVQVKIDIADNPGIASLKFDVGYDEYLTLTNVEFNSAFGTYVTAPTPYKNPQTISMISPLSNVNQNGTFAVLTFKISDNAPVNYTADITLTYDPDDVFNSDYDNVPTKIVNGHVTIGGTDTDIFTMQVGQAAVENGTVILDKNDGSANITQTTVPMNGKTKLPTPTKSGYTCVGWSESKDAVLPKYKCGTEITPNTDMNLYAVWAKNNTRVTNVSVNDVSLNYKDTVKIAPSVKATAGTKYVVEWSSSDTDIAKVDSFGNLTATKRGKGSTIITCKVTDQFGNVVKDTCKVDVSLTPWQWIKTYIFFGWIWY